MSARLTTLARRWNVDLVSMQEYGHASGTHEWQAGAVSKDLGVPRGCILANAPTREAALFLLKQKIDAARAERIAA